MTRTEAETAHSHCVLTAHDARAYSTSASSPTIPQPLDDKDSQLPRKRSFTDAMAEVLQPPAAPPPVKHTSTASHAVSLSSSPRSPIWRLLHAHCHRFPKATLTTPPPLLFLPPYVVRRSSAALVGGGADAAPPPLILHLSLHFPPSSSSLTPSSTP